MAMNEQPPKWQIGNKCRHFNGLLNEKCKAGVVYETVKGERPKFLPCFQDEYCSERCSLVSYYTEEEVAEREKVMQEAAAAYLNNLNAGICPTCKTPFSEEVQIGRCVYAAPCNHRLYQGTAKKKEPKLHPYLQEMLDKEQS